jgi:peptidoglycan/xylan/chitin deacetylase (PgdA/CDA1 family)
MDEKALALLAQNELITLGSHSVTHPRFTTLDVEERRKELTDSRRKLEEVAGKKVDSFAFPYGDYDKEIVAQAREEGYENIFSIIPAYASLGDEEEEFGRMWVDPSDGELDFFLKLMGAYRWIPKVQRIIPILP